MRPILSLNWVLRHLNPKYSQWLEVGLNGWRFSRWFIVYVVCLLAFLHVACRGLDKILSHWEMMGHMQMAGRSAIPPVNHGSEINTWLWKHTSKWRRRKPEWTRRKGDRQVISLDVPHLNDQRSEVTDTQWTRLGHNCSVLGDLRWIKPLSRGCYYLSDKLQSVSVFLDKSHYGSKAMEVWTASWRWRVSGPKACIMLLGCGEGVITALNPWRH